ncbi:DUF2157 domain-containing protein [Colwellia sp. D2M02]|uniref:DUF2157 domain-containing protein n=1 Tax=Colwellia sp. D2M02 TaxID=2841562 RepID=UPI001C092074|nr:DUF2157 domain-containing protein [Colwellia sp. D2M02]MBU2891863.1 DUF2157 domain-containing protein [Colwellia sp. D2M02]
MESSRGELVNLIEQEKIAKDNIKQAINIANIHPAPKAWFDFINQLLLWLGCVSLGLSVIFFIAHNWSEIGRFAKFALVEISLIFAIIVYVKTKPQTNASNGALITATLLLGALMALFGQTYQTGADPWQLFFNWALFILPWALIARFTSLWIIWLALLNIALALYCDVNTNPLSLFFTNKVNPLWLFIGLNSFIFACWHTLSLSRTWMKKTWAIRVIALVTGTLITENALLAIVDDYIIHTLALPVWGVFLGAIYWLYRKVSIDLFMLSGACLSGIVVLTALVGNGVIFSGDGAEYLLISIIVIGLGSGSAFWLKQVQQEMN